jgi:hypothetical protein
VIDYCDKHGLFKTDAKVGGQGKCPWCAEEEAKNPIKPDVTVVAGQDLAKHRDFSTYVSLAIQNKVATVKRLNQWPHTDYSIVMEDTKTFYKEDGCRELGVDLGNAGEPLVEQYRANGVNANGILFTSATKDEMIIYVRNLLQRKKAGTPPHLELPRSGPFVEELLTQMKEQERIIGASDRPHYDHPPDRHDDLLWALNIACYVARGYLSNPHWAVMIRHEPEKYYQWPWM